MDVQAFEELEGKVQQLEISVNRRVEELKERIVENEAKVVQNVVKAGERYDEISDTEEQRDIDARRSNVIIYRAKEIDSELADDRKAGDALLICA